MSETPIPEKVLYTLWGRAGGICEICGTPLTVDNFNKKLKHRGYAAHIYGEKPRAARYDAVKSKKYSKDIDYLMILCDSCHKRIDIDEPENNSVDKLIKIKKEHEDFISKVVSCKNKPETQAITCVSKIADNLMSAFDTNIVNAAILNNKKNPASVNPVSLLRLQDGIYDDDNLYWESNKKILETNFKNFISINPDIKHLSVFAIAPQPLLILLGTLIGDILDADIYQKHREHKSWDWSSEQSNGVEFKIIEPTDKQKENIAIKFSLSANIQDAEITQVLGENTAIWTLTINEPNKYFVDSIAVQHAFSYKFAELLDKIKENSSGCKSIGIFPAMPLSLAIEAGRVKMEKADLSFSLYDYNKDSGGFIKAFDIN